MQRHKTKLLDDVPEIDRLVGVFDREHIVEAVRGKENPRQEHGHFLGKYHDLSRELAQAQGLQSVGFEKETKTNRLPVFEDDRARLRLTPRHYAYLRISEGCNQGCTLLHDPVDPRADALQADRADPRSKRRSSPPTARSS